MWISCPNKDNAVKIAKGIVIKKLVYFTQIFPVESLYEWEGKVQPDHQYVIFTELDENKLKAAEDEIQKLHVDTVPCWSVFKVSSISKASQEWMESIKE